MFTFEIINISRANYEEQLRNVERARRFSSNSIRVPSPFLQWLNKLAGRLVANKETAQGRTLSRPTPAR